jgi:diaminopimelate epimerase
MFIDFEKWHGAKNDFIVTWILTTDADMIVPTLQRLAPTICARDGSGVGADGILVMVARSRKSHEPEELVIINSDGSIAKNCGNGLRCAAMSAHRKSQAEGIIDFDGLTITVQGQGIDCRFLGRDGSPFVAVTMPTAQIGPSNDWHDDVITRVRALQTDDRQLKGDLETVSLGNPHVVINVDRASAELAAKAGAPLQKARGGDGINVHIVSSSELTDKDHQRAKRDLNEDVGELLTVFPWERGVGPTQACGTGACAVGVAALATGLSERDLWIAIDMPGGRLYVKQDSEDDPVILAGPAEFVFAGRLEI